MYPHASSLPHPATSRSACLTAQQEARISPIQGDGAVAQLGERVVRNDEVRGSIPLGSTTLRPYSLISRQSAARTPPMGRPIRGRRAVALANPPGSGAGPFLPMKWGGGSPIGRDGGAARAKRRRNSALARRPFDPFPLNVGKKATPSPPPGRGIKGEGRAAAAAQTRSHWWRSRAAPHPAHARHLLPGRGEGRFSAPQSTTLVIPATLFRGRKLLPRESGAKRRDPFSL